MADTPPTESESDISRLFSGNYLNLVQQGHWEYAERSNASAVIAICALHEGNLILTEQFRPPVGKVVIDIPAGLAGDIPGQETEALETAAARELFEETGYEAEDWTYKIELPTSPGLTSETVHLFTAQTLKKTGTGGGDDSEEIIVREIPLSEIRSCIDQELEQGKLIDPKVFLALYLLNAVASEDN